MFYLKPHDHVVMTETLNRTINVYGKLCGVLPKGTEGEVVEYLNGNYRVSFPKYGEFMLAPQWVEKVQYANN